LPFKFNLCRYIKVVPGKKKEVDDGKEGSGGRVVTPGWQISYMGHTECHQLNRVLTAK
jgi:hypothetical protein